MEAWIGILGTWSDILDAWIWILETWIGIWRIWIDILDVWIDTWDIWIDNRGRSMGFGRVARGHWAPIGLLDPMGAGAPMGSRETLGYFWRPRAPFRGILDSLGAPPVGHQPRPRQPKGTKKENKK